MIDEQIFQNLKATMGDVLPILIDAFKEDGLLLLQDIQNGTKNDDLKQVSVAAHTLKSSAHNVGATILAGYCTEIETLLANSESLDKDQLAELHKQSVDEMQRVQESLDIHLAAL